MMAPFTLSTKEDHKTQLMRSYIHAVPCCQVTVNHPLTGQVLHSFGYLQTHIHQNRTNRNLVIKKNVTVEDSPCTGVASFISDLYSA